MKSVLNNVTAYTRKDPPPLVFGGVLVIPRIDIYLGEREAGFRACFRPKKSELERALAEITDRVKDFSFPRLEDLSEISIGEAFAMILRNASKGNVAERDRVKPVALKVTVIEIGIQETESFIDVRCQGFAPAVSQKVKDTLLPIVSEFTEKYEGLKIE